MKNQNDKTKIAEVKGGTLVIKNGVVVDNGKLTLNKDAKVKEGALMLGNEENKDNDDISHC